MTTKTVSEYKVENNNLFVLFQKNQDLKIRNHILELNLGLVKKEASHWISQCQESYDDLLQVGSIGLIRAIEKYDVEKGYAFSSFAIPFIKGEIQHYLRDKGYSIRIPRRCLELKDKSHKIILSLKRTLNRQPTDNEIARELGISLGEWEDVKLAHQNRETVSLDITTNEEDERNTIADLIPDQQYHNFQLAQEDVIRLQNALFQLEEGTRKALEFVFLQDLTQKETADRLGVSVVTISRRIQKGLTCMKRLVTAEDLD